jgi:hypothetical protein
MKYVPLLSIVFFFVLSFSSCQKYEEGPGFTLRTKKARITGEWRLTRVVDEDFNGSSPNEQLSWYIYKDGSIEIEQFGGSWGGNISVTGKWEFLDEKETLSLSMQGEYFSGDYKILRLTMNDLWILDETPSGNFQYRFTKERFDW